MTKDFSIEEFSLVNLNQAELSQIEGGGFWGKVVDAVIGWVVGEVLDEAKNHVATNSFANPAPRTYPACDNV